MTSRWVGIDAIMTEGTQIHFLSYVLVAVASLDSPQCRTLHEDEMLVYKALNGMAPLYITELLSYRTCSRTLRSTDQKLLAVPKSRLKTYGDRAFSVAASKLWNELPLAQVTQALS